MFVALVGLATPLLSDTLRQGTRRFVSRHVYRARHDSRQVWMLFTERTAAVVDTQELCTVVTRLVADTVAVHSVTIWLWQETAPGRVRCGGSTVFSEEQASAPGLTEEEMAELITYLRQHQGLVDFATPSDAPGKALRCEHLSVG